ncbi:MAG: YggT family protein [Spirochaetaceae bacterium]|nr:MAG: YggT family protein [Spirochaetaceae bacterium]
MIQTIARFISSALTVYMMIIFVRIVMTWFSGVSYGRFHAALASVTDPYLNWFRRNTPVRFGVMDFSPIVGILTLGVAQNVFTQLAVAGRVTLAYLLAVSISAVWSVISFFATIFLIMAALRLVGMLTGLDARGSRLWIVLEQVVNPLLQVVVRPFLRGRFTSYRDSLLIFCGVLLATIVAGRIAVSLVISLVRQIPF